MFIYVDPFLSRNSSFSLLRYDKIHNKGSTSEDESGSALGNAATKYVILEEMEDQDHGP